MLRSLAEWGAQTLGAPAVDDCWSMYAVHARFRQDAAVDGVYEIRFEGGEMQVGSLDAIRGEVGEPTLVMEADPASTR